MTLQFFKLYKVTALVIPAVILAAGSSMVAAESIEQRVGRMERVLDSQSLVDMATRLEQIQKDLQLLRGEIELQGHTLAGLKKRQRDLYLDIDQRLRRLESGGAAASAPPASVPQTPAVPTAPAVSSAPSSASTPPPQSAATAAPAKGERGAYQRAFNLLKEGRYDQASGDFRRFLSSYPQSSYASNAQYWLGEAFYVTRQFDEALTEFNKVVSVYPNSSKLGDALLKIGFIYYEQEQWGKAKATLSEIIKRYPNTTVARLADNRLRRMKLERR